MTLVTITPHMGAQWVGIEATTLSSAQLIYFHRHKRSLEATWKYLIICSVGIALALLGNILLSVAFHGAEGATGAADGMDHTAGADEGLQVHGADGRTLGVVVQRRVGVCAHVRAQRDGAHVHRAAWADAGHPLLAVVGVTRKHRRVRVHRRGNVPELLRAWGMVFHGR